MPTTVITPASSPPRDGHHVVGVLADPHRVGPRLRDQQADDVAADDPEHAEVEQRAADAQQPVLVELGGAGGPAELVVAVAPQVADDEGGQAEVGDDHEEELVHRAGSRERRHGQQGRLGRGAGGRAGAELRAGERREPDLLLGRALGGETAYGVALVAAQRRQRRGDARRPGCAHGEPMSRSESRSSSSPARWSSIRSRPRSLVDGGGELEHDAEVVGQLGVVELEPGARGRSA